MSFHPEYVRRVLDPSYRNWLRYFADESKRVHRAHLVMLAERHLIPAEAVRSIKAGMDALEHSFSPPDHIPDGVEDLYFLFERELAAKVGMEHAGYLHTARSRNDMDTTIFRLALKRRLAAFLRGTLSTANSLLARARGAISDPIVLYTHGQPANASTLGHYLSAMLMEVVDDCGLIEAGLETVDRSTMGACAITTTGFAVDRERVSNLLGLARPVTSSYQAISTSHWLTFPACACAQLMIDLTRFAADLGHKASAEVGVLRFPDDLVQVSSIMPQKRNPVILEHIRIQAGLARGAFQSVVDLFTNVPYQDVNEVADAPVARFFEALETADSALTLFDTAIRAASVDAERCRRIAVDFGTTTTELADTLVRELRMSFREAHALTQQFVRSRYDKKALRRAFREVRGRDLEWTDARIDDILTPEWFVAVRQVPGGPAPEGMISVFEEAERRLAVLTALPDRLAERERHADAALGAAYRAL